MQVPQVRSLTAALGLLMLAGCGQQPASTGTPIDLIVAGDLVLTMDEQNSVLAGGAVAVEASQRPRKMGPGCEASARAAGGRVEGEPGAEAGAVQASSRGRSTAGSTRVARR